MAFRLFRWIIILFFISNGYSQNVNMAGIFPTIDHSAKLSDKYLYGIYYFGAHPLFSVNKFQITSKPFFNLFYAEHSLTRSINRFSVTASYVYQRENVLKENFINENRIHIQGKYSHKFRKINFTHRLRYDARFINPAGDNNSFYAGRVRYLIGGDYDLKHEFYTVIYQEVFYNTSSQKLFDYAENWAYKGFGKKINPNNKLEVGMLFITWKLSPKSWFNQYYLQLTWINKLNFSSNK